MSLVLAAAAHEEQLTTQAIAAAVGPEAEIGAEMSVMHPKAPQVLLQQEHCFSQLTCHG